MDTIRAPAIRAHMSFLADDLLEGRDTGTRGYRIASRYVAAQLEAMGLEPAGDDGSFFQSVPLRSSTIDATESSLTLIDDGRPRPLRIGKDFLLAPPFRETEARVRGELVFAGYGVSAPELDYDDYDGLDVTGKVVLQLSGAPSRFESTERAYYSSRETKAAEAVRRGALATLTIFTPTDAARIPWAFLERAMMAPSMRWLDPATGEPSGASAALGASGVLSREAATELFRETGHPLSEIFDQTEPPRFELSDSVTLRAVGRHEDIESPNVVARRQGTDLGDEVVVYSAHLDHVGIGREVDGDAIYNGAYDNASGVAVLLAVAEAYSRMRPPRRSLLFLAVTAEEKGLLGSDYFAEHPSVPKESIVANVNADGALMLHPLHDVVAFGAEHSSLMAPVSRAAEALGIEIVPDFMPEEVIFIRSDQYSFVKRGVPSVYAFVGTETGSPRVDGGALLREWMSTRYHKPQDDMSQEIDFAAGAGYARLTYLIGYLVANENERPTWNEDDFLAEKFALR